MNQIRNVAVAGATGNVGSKVLQALLDVARFKVTVLTRKEGHPFPKGVETRVVNYDSIDSLSEAVKGHDAVIDCTVSIDGDSHIHLMDAAAATGVYRFIPSEFSFDPTNKNRCSIPVFTGKCRAFEHIRQLAEQGKITYTTISNGAFLDWNLKTGFMNIDLSKRTIALLNDGKVVIAWTTLDSVGKATASALLNPRETENKALYIHSIQKSQREVAAIAQEALGKDGWKTTSVDMEKTFAKALEDFRTRQVSFQVIGDLIRYGNSRPDYGFPWTKDDNELLGVKALDDEEVKQLIRDIASQAA
ncbi:hypothetical protein RU639_008715 [Aspergillus parasiticus]